MSETTKFKVGDRAGKVFQMAQSLQDARETWGAALKAAETLLDYNIVKPYE